VSPKGQFLFEEITLLHLTFANRSGAGRFVASLVQAQARHSPDVSLACPSDFEYIGETQAAGVRVYPVVPVIPRKLGVVRFIYYNTMRSLRAAVRVAGLCRRERILHANFLGAPAFGIVTFGVLRLCRFKIILTVHDVLPHTWLLPQCFRRTEQRMHKWLYRLADQIVVLHRGAAEEMHVVFRIPEGRIHVIPHGTFQLGQRPVPMPESAEITALLFGSIRRNKGIDLAIRAVQKLRKSGCPIRLRIVGVPFRKAQSYWNDCKAQIQAQPDGIDYQEAFIADEDIPRELRTCHFVLLPYCDFGSQSGVASLALSNGRAIVATQAGGLRDLLTHKTGIVIRQKSANAVADAIRIAVDLGQKGLAELGSSACEWFLQEYSWDSIALRHLKLYENHHPRTSPDTQDTRSRASHGLATHSSDSSNGD